MTNPKFVIFKSPINSNYYYHLKDSNGEKILSGNGYKTIEDCRIGITSVKENARLDLHYDRKNSLTSYTFNLKAADGEIIGRSENYRTSVIREIGILAVKRNAPNAPIEVFVF